MKKELEQRAYNFEIRAEENENEVIITGRPIVYNSMTDLGWFDEVIESHALDATDLTDVRFLVNHDMSRIPLARSRRNNGNSTMKLTPDELGLNMDYVRLDVKNNPEAAALASAVNRGDITGMSFRFSIDDERWENLESEHPTRHILKIGSVVEVSAVSFPAYEATSIEISARSKEALENARAALESAREKKPLDSGIELEKAKTIILTGGKIR